jgi:hypothetical protein
MVSTDFRSVINEFMVCLPARDWGRMARTLAADVRRIGIEGESTDLVIGRDPYLAWLSGFADKLFEYSWTTHRIIFSDNDLSAVVDCSTRYRLEENSEPFGYRLVMIFDVGGDGLIHSVDLYWKTPSQRVPGDTIGAGR